MLNPGRGQGGASCQAVTPKGSLWVGFPGISGTQKAVGLVQPQFLLQVLNLWIPAEVRDHSQISCHWRQAHYLPKLMPAAVIHPQLFSLQCMHCTS